MKFIGSKLETIYLHELWWLASNIREKSNEIFSKTKEKDDECKKNIGQYWLGSDPEIHSLISSILNSAANIKKLVKTHDSKSRGESTKQYKLRKERAATLMDLIHDIDISEILNHKIRNTLEHFDEYLDASNVEISSNEKFSHMMAGYNIVLSDWNVINPRVYPIRIYVSLEKKFYNMKWSVDIGKLHYESSEIIQRLASKGFFTEGTPPCGLALPI